MKPTHTFVAIGFFTLFSVWAAADDYNSEEPDGIVELRRDFHATTPVGEAPDKFLSCANEKECKERGWDLQYPQRTDLYEFDGMMKVLLENLDKNITKRIGEKNVMFLNSFKEAIASGRISLDKLLNTDKLNPAAIPDGQYIYLLPGTDKDQPALHEVSMEMLSRYNAELNRLEKRITDAGY